MNESIHQEIITRPIQKVIDRINADLSEALTLEALAAEAGFSPFHFHRIFSAQTGETPGNYLQRLRLERAANLLLKSSQPVTAITFACGFSSPAVFARAFRQRYGMSASEYRQRRGAGALSIPEHVPSPRVDLNLNQIQVTLCPDHPVIYVANLAGYTLEKICAAWDHLYRWAAARRLLTAQALAIGVTYDDPAITAGNRCRYYACLSVARPVETGQRVGYMKIEGGLHAVCRVTCSAEQIESVYHQLYGEWLPGSGFQPADRPTYEIYLRTPEQHPEGKYEMEVRLPVEAVREY